MTDPLNPTEEHYLKRELLKFQLNHEFAALNDQYALRKFGYPFSSSDPTAPKAHTPIKGALKHAVTSISSPTLSSQRTSISDRSVESEIQGFNNTEFPMLSYVLKEFIMPFPLLSKESSMAEGFWQEKVQVFFEHFMSLGFSDSYDREESTKRRRISKKLNKAILLLFNSGIGTSQEAEYYEKDKFILQQTKAKKSTLLEEFAMPTRENLQYLLTKEPIFIGGWDINIVAVVTDVALFGKKKRSVAQTSVGNAKSSPLSPKWMKNTFGITASPAALFSKLTIMDASGSTKSSRNTHHFILKVTKESDPKNTFYCAKSYDDFKQLAHSLKTEFPGKQLARLPHKTKKSVSVVTSLDFFPESQVPSTPKEKIISSFSSDSPSSASLPVVDDLQKPKEDLEDDEDTDDLEEFQDAADTKNSNLISERMRTSLRQYLRTLCSDKEVSLSANLSKFLTATTINPEKFSKEIQEDISHRKMVDVTNLENQVRFQKLALEKSLELQDAMKEFKTSLLKDENYLLGLVQEIKEKSKMKDLSPLLLSFVEWCKIYLSSTIYQIFLGNDSGYEFYTQVKRLHRLMPYSVMGQIMRFTNPMGIMKAMIELFMAQPFGSQSLLQTMFSTILSDDLKSQEKIIQELERKALQDAKLSLEVIQCLKNTVFKNEYGEIIDMESAHKESESTKMPISLVILLRNAETGKVSHEAVGEIIESYSAWKLQQKSTADLMVDDNESQGQYFSHIKELLQLYIRERDKRLMRKLWQDPELSQLLKSIMTLLYEPMVRIFKVARVDIALKNFERFMNDLIKLVDDVLNGQLGGSTQFSVVEGINDLVTKHQDSFLEFIHDVYNHDTEGIFEGFITWIVKVVKFLQQSKFGTDNERIDFNQLLRKSDVEINLFVKQLDNLIDKKQVARKTYRKLLDLKMKDEEKKMNGNATKVLESKWKELNSFVLPSNNGTFGLQDGELVDLDLDAADYDYLCNDDECVLEKEYQELLDEKVEDYEIEKFGKEVFEHELKKILFPYPL